MRISPYAVTMNAHSRLAFNASVDAEASVVNRGIAWSSTDPGVASVDACSGLGHCDRRRPIIRNLLETVRETARLNARAARTRFWGRVACVYCAGHAPAIESMARSP